MTEPQPEEREPEGTEQEQPDEETKPKVYDEAYVKALREEAAENRIGSKRANEYLGALRMAVKAHVTASILQDPETLAWHPTFDDEEGMPNPDAIREAAEALAAGKPHLARVGGEVLQGHRGDESDAGVVDLAGLLRSGA